jgi:hypothetical protein
MKLIFHHLDFSKMTEKKVGDSSFPAKSEKIGVAGLLKHFFVRPDDYDPAASKKITFYEITNPLAR